ncbi:OLC1v1018997C1 [Oldenlandia corymbosa var. corymbosa]|uniref:OLC1v1018997C1 n=1 Tax=Oldenlandia corymbosa var. corymbosa TaxID=529605 RepID=A0AAV1EDF3_OLDCO|nr:OLC1v1018997C1 [Oldenlandia corymbosa var. corymbosa]
MLQMSDISESSSKSYGVSRTVWTEGDMKLFVDILLEYKRKGEMKQNNFGKSWVQITKDFNAKSEYRQTLEQLSQKFHRFRIDWNAFKDLREKHTGLGWDHQKGTITASEERWKELIKCWFSWRICYGNGAKSSQESSGRLVRMFETIRDEDGDKSSGKRQMDSNMNKEGDSRGKKMSKGNSKEDVFWEAATEAALAKGKSQVDVSGGKKAVVIHVPYKLRKAFRKIHVRLVRELEKKFSGKYDVLLQRLSYFSKMPYLSVYAVQCVIDESNNVSNDFKIAIVENCFNMPIHSVWIFLSCLHENGSRGKMEGSSNLNNELMDYSSSSDEEELEEWKLLRMVKTRKTKLSKTPCRTSALTGHQYVREVIFGHHARIVQNCRITVDTFSRLCDVLREGNYLSEHHQRQVSVEEALAMFLNLTGTDGQTYVISERFQHSRETVQRNIDDVVQALVRFSSVIIAPRNEQEVHPRIRNSTKFYPWFKVNA